MTTERAGIQNPDRRQLLELETRVSPVPGQAGDLRVHVVYPNHYWVAMSNLGFQAVHHIFESEQGVTVERGFLPDDCFEPKVAASPWKTFESNKPIADCDLLGFSLSFETDYPHLVKILKNQKLLACGAPARDELARNSSYGFPIIIAGGTGVTLNPEPVADLVDVIALGEAEELIPEMVAVIRKGKKEGRTREEVLADLTSIEGLYVPRFHHPRYNESGSVVGFDVDEAVRRRPHRRFVKDISKFPTFSRILTPETEFKSMFLTETGRGCEMGCRFCVAGYIYRPIRKRSEESIAETVKIGLENSDAIGFVGAAVSSHKAISRLARSVAESGARASLSSIMSQKVTKELAASISESEYKTVALAPEAGTDRLRRAAGKRVPNSQVLSAAVDLAQAGIRGFKLYFIVGLPTETDLDVDGIAQLAIELRNRVVEASKSSGTVAWVTLSVNPFIPKANTPFQWEPMLDVKSLERKIDQIRELIKRVPNLEMKFESPKESYFQALLSRGDRRVAGVLIRAEEEGKDWKWILQQARKGAFSGLPNLDFYATRRIPFDEILPWEVVDSRIDRKLLEREARRAHAGDDENGDAEGTPPAGCGESLVQLERSDRSTLGAPVVA